MNVSEQGLSNAHFNIPNGCLTKKLQPFKDDNKIEKSDGFWTRSHWKTIDILSNTLKSEHSFAKFSDHRKNLLELIRKD
jgi:hypothetical protein